MTQPYHGPGVLLDGHNADPAAHSAAGLLAASAVAGDELLVPYGALIAASGASTWYLANAMLLMRATVRRTKTYRWANLNVGVQSGNIQIVVASVRRSGTSLFATRVMDSGVIACPASGAARVDLTATSLPAGEYLVGFWCDNTTATFMHSLASGFASTRMLWETTGIATGLTSAERGLSPTTRWVSGLTVESDS